MQIAPSSKVTNAVLADRFVSLANLKSACEDKEVCAIAWEFLTTLNESIAEIWTKHGNLNSLNIPLKQLGLKRKRALRWVKEEIQLGLGIPLGHAPHAPYHRDNRKERKVFFEPEPAERALYSHDLHYRDAIEEGMTHNYFRHREV